MDIDEFLWKERMTLRQLAKHVGTSEVTLGSLKRKERAPSLPIAYKLHMFSKGKIGYNDLLTEYQKEKLRGELKKEVE